MTIALIGLCLFLAGGDYLIRGGDQQIFSFYFKRIPIPSNIPGAHIIAALLTAVYLGPFLNLVIGLTGYKLVEVLTIHAAFWFLAIMSAWQGYYSIGTSTGSRRATVGWIDWVLDQTFGPIFYNVPRTTAAPGRNTAWWIGRDGVGMFLRMCHAFPLFLALGLFFDHHWYILLALEYTLAFAFVTVLIYGGYNWLPIFRTNTGDVGLNWSEFFTGAWLAACIFTFICVIKNTPIF